VVVKKKERNMVLGGCHSYDSTQTQYDKSYDNKRKELKQRFHKARVI